MVRNGTRTAHLNLHKIANTNGTERDVEEEVLLDEYLSERKLISATGESNLSKVKYLELIVNTNENTLGELGVKLPNLAQLKLSGSIIPSIRDLGTSLGNLKVLWLSRCGLIELDGISALVNLVEAYLSFNNIEDISVLSSLEHLQILDLEGNSINDIEQVQYLVDCKNLISLTLEDNEIFFSPTYRNNVCCALPQLGYLDDIPVTDKERKIAIKRIEKNTKPEDDRQREINIVKKAIKFMPVDENEEQLINIPIIVTVTPRSSVNASDEAKIRRPMSATGLLCKESSYGRPITTSSLSNSPKNYSTKGTLPARPQTARMQRPMTAWSRDNGILQKSNLNNNSDDETNDSSSMLTYGSKEVLCGNPVKALRKRKKEANEDLELNNKSIINPSYGNEEDILSELIAEKIRRINFSENEDETDTLE